jgi:hypothetical protein
MDFLKMYLARVPKQGNGYLYKIRQSYDDGLCYRSRDLFDLGDSPSKFIIYPGGNSFYIDTVVEETIAQKGVFVSQDDLEPIFLPFLAPHIRRVINGFDRKTRHQKSSDTCVPVESFHIFDRYRLHFLKQGWVDVREMGCTPDRFYSGLQHKSRDEIEYDFITAERILKSQEFSRYTYQIFDLQSYFTERFARSHPEAIDQKLMDRVFIKALCKLNRDEAFWLGSDEEDGLRKHLVRYAIMYFDSNFPSHDPIRDFWRDFMNRHRTYRPSQSVQVSMAESARLFNVTVETLKKMDCRALTRQYRKIAMKHHPDKGGDKETFVKLNAAYHKLLERKSSVP